MENDETCLSKDKKCRGTRKIREKERERERGEEKKMDEHKEEL